MKSTSLESLSADVMLEVTGWLCRSDILHLCFCSSVIYGRTIGMLYQVVELFRGDQCSRTLAMLHKHPEIARHVRKLVVRLETPPPRFMSNSTVTAWDASFASRRVKMAAPCMDALNTFVWAGEIYPEDDMWEVLRTSCPLLKTIGVHWSILPSIRSHLFDFHDLHGFSINFGSEFYHRMLFFVSPETEPVFMRLWDMLIIRCPDLRELSITTHGATNSVDLVDAHNLCQGRWPNLRSLHLGNVSLDWPSDSERTPFITFLKNHASLESLQLSAHFGVPHEHLSQITPSSLPKLDDFAGSLDHLQALPHSMHFKSIRISQALVVRELTPSTISNVLQSKSLSFLKVTFILQSGYDSVGVLRSISSSCPQLRSLDLTCSHKPSFSLDSFSRAIRNLLRLRYFHLTIVKVQDDESMSEGAIRIARTNPRLEGFSITYIHHYHGKVNEKGEFELTCDGHGLPLSLYVKQLKHTIWGASSSSYRCDLRPIGHPGLPRRGWTSLLLDKSQAGKDLRALLVSTLLVFVAISAVCTR